MAPAVSSSSPTPSTDASQRRRRTPERESASILGDQKDATNRGDQKVIDSLHRSKELGCEIGAALERGDLVRFGQLL